MIKHKVLPSKSELCCLFSYKKETGSLTWRPGFDKKGRPNTRLVGQEAGYVGTGNYRVVMINEQNYAVHRIIWKMINGSDPLEEIDHKNNDRLDNKWSNLREATHSQNNHNVPVKKHSVSGIKGIRCIKGRWYATIRKDYKQYHIGVFDDVNSAIMAHADAAKRLYGSSARPN